MADLHTIPFLTLVDRLDRELTAGGDLFTIRQRDWWSPDPARDLSLVHHGARVGTPSGPAAGPHTQLAQNIVMAWLTGGRFMELKTVQVMDELEIPRPCIRVPHVGYNVEWSQELRLPRSSREYAKAWLLVHMLASEQGPGLWPGVDTVFDTSAGYDLDGLRSPTVRRFLDEMRDASGIIDELRASLPPRLARWARVATPTQISDTITLSTFHGCPAHEIEAIATQTLDWGWHTTIKLNPTLLGYDRVRGLMDDMGYTHIQLDPHDFQVDLGWPALMEMLPRLAAHAADKGLGFGVKFSNTLVCHSEEAGFPRGASDRGEVYMSGPPLHVIATALAARLRAEGGVVGALPITFSAGIDKDNFAATVGAGLGPVTTCSDLLKGRGYARQAAYLRALEANMKRRDVTDLDGWREVIARDDRGTPVAALAARVEGDPRYARPANTRFPRKIGSQLVMLDCLSCDKCIPVCPNGANFSVPVPVGEHRPGTLRWTGDRFELEEGEALVVRKRHQIANTADVCNECGQCDTWCPEDGGPYLAKPRLFVSQAAWDARPDDDGFLVDPDRQGIRWRNDGQEYRLRLGEQGESVLELGGGRVTLVGDTPVVTEGEGHLDLRLVVTMRLYLAGFSKAEGWLPPATGA